MPRKPKPFLHQGAYYTTAGGTWTRLCDEAAGADAADHALAALLAPPSAIRLRDAVAKYAEHCRGYYVLPSGRVSSEPRSVELAFGYFTRVAGDIPTAQLSADHLKAARELMLKTCSRKTINQHVGRVKRGCAWMAEEKLMPAAVAAELQALRNLPAFRSGAAEYDPVAAVPWDQVAAVVGAIQEPWRSLILLQWWSGLRPGEACGLKVAQVAPAADETFAVDLGLEHKGGWRGKRKTVQLGAQASAVVRPWVWSAEVTGREFLFATTWTARGAAPRPATPSSYAHAVARCCDAQKLPHWHPNQLRHSYATRIRAALGLEAAQHGLGHAHLSTSEIYAEKNAEMSAKVARLQG